MILMLIIIALMLFFIDMNLNAIYDVLRELLEKNKK